MRTDCTTSELIVQESDVKKDLNNIQENKIVGPERDSTNNSKTLTTNFSKSLSEMKSPSIWKTAYVTPLH